VIFEEAIYLGNQTKILELLKENETLENRLIAACFLGDLSMLQKVLQEGGTQINLNTQMKNGETAFFLACQNGHLEIVQKLLENDILDFNRPNYLQESPIFKACQNKHWKVGELLLKTPGINIRVRNKKQQTLRKVLEKHNPSFIQLLDDTG